MTKEEFITKISNSIIVGPYELKSYFLLLRDEYPLINFSYENKENVLENIFGKYNEQAIIAAMKLKNLTYNIAKKELSYLVSGSTNRKEYESIYEKSLIYTDKYYKKLYQDKHIIFLVYTIEDLEIKHLISQLNLSNYEFLTIEDLPLSKNNQTYLRFDNVKKEVKYVLNDIANKIDKNKLTSSSFVIYCDEGVYAFYLKTYAHLIGLPLSFDQDSTLYDTYSAKILIDHIDDFNVFVEENSQLFLADEDNFKKIKNLYNFFDLEHDKNRIINFCAILKDYKVSEDSYLNAVKVTSKVTFDIDKFVYVLGAIDSFIPRMSKNNDYIDDILKEKYLLSTSVIENKYLYQIILKFLSCKHVVHISFSDNNGQNNIAFMLSNNGFTEEKTQIQLLQYSKKICELSYASYLHILKYYSSVDKEMPYLRSYFKDIKKYNNSFKGIKDTEAKKNNYSYTSLETYSECAFRYYCDRVLGLSTFEENTATKFGNLAHKLFESIYEGGFDFDKNFNEIKSGYVFSDQEECLLNRFKKELKCSADAISEQNKLFPFKDTKSEYKIEIDKGTYMVNGRIDRINFYNSGYSIIDYKSGKFDFNLFYFETYKLYMQIPMYLYLMKSTKEFSKLNVIGAFIQPISRASFYNYYKLDKKAIDEIKLKGIASKDINIYGDFDYSFDEKSCSKFVEKCKYSDKTKLISVGKTSAYNQEQFIDLANKVSDYIEEFNKEIVNNNFEINPYKLDDEKYACKYCEYEDICFRKEKDYRKLLKKREAEGALDNGND